MPSSVDKGSLQEAYEDVRSDSSTTQWATFKYSESVIAHSESGEEYNELIENLSDEERIFAYVRMTTGDELSKRAKFCLITWIGDKVPPLQRARVSMDKMLVKEVLKVMAIEIQTSEIEDVQEQTVLEAIMKAGGANYGTAN